MKLIRHFEVGDTVRFKYGDKIKEGKLRYEPHIITEELSESFNGSLPIGMFYYTIKTLERDYIILERDIL
jgi:hypothetical protein